MANAVSIPRECVHKISEFLKRRILSLLDKPGMRAVIKASVDWASAFSRTDPTKTISKFIRMGLRSSLTNILIEFLDNR